MHYTNVAFNGLNDFYNESLVIPFTGGNLKEMNIVNNAIKQIKLRNLLTNLDL